MEFANPMESAVVKLLHAQLPVPDNINMLYAVALEGGLSTDEIQAVADEIQTGKPNVMRARESEVWNKFYGDVSDQYTDPNYTDVGPGSGLSEYFPFPYVDQSDPDNDIYGYEARLGGARPAVPDYNSVSHPGVADASLSDYAQDPDYQQKYVDRLAEWNRANTGPEADSYYTALSAVNHPQIAINKLMEKFLGKPSGETADPRSTPDSAGTHWGETPNIPNTQGQVPQGNPTDEYGYPAPLPDWRVQGYDPRKQKKQ